MRTDVSPLASIFESLEPRLMLSGSQSLPDGGEDNDASAYDASVTAGTASAALPLSPTVVDTIDADGVVRKIYVFGSLAFAVGDAGVQIASIADPTSPSVLANIATAASVTSITVANSTLYVGLNGGTLAIYDISDPADPAKLGQMSVPAAFGGTVSINGIAFLDNGSGSQPKRLYLACLAEGVKVIDVTTPANPSLLGGGGDGTIVRDVAIVGSGTGGWANNALAVIMGDYVYLMSVSDPDNPITGSVRKFSTPTELFADGTKLYVTDSKGLHLLDARSFTSPASRGTVAPSPYALSSYFDIAAPAGGQLAYFSQIGVGVTIVDTGAAGGPKVIGTFADADAKGIAAYGTTLYVADGDSSWQVVDTGVSRDLTVSNSDGGNYYISPGKTFKINISVNNLGNLAVMANQGISVTAFLSVDGTLTSTPYQLTPVTYFNSSIAALTDLAKTLSVKAPTGVPDGYYYLILKLSPNGSAADGDTSNDLWISPTASVQVMTGKPGITMTMDADDDSNILGDNITNISSVSFTGTTRADCTVVLKRGSKVLGTTTSAGDGSFSFADVALVSGKNSLSVTVTDRAGNKSTLSQKIVLDTAVSASSMKLDRSTDSGKAGDFLTNVAAVKLTGKTEKGAGVVLLVNDVQVASTVASSKGAFSFTSVVLSDGVNDVTVQITDAAGNTTDVTKAITLDTAADTPTLAIVPAFDTAPLDDNITGLAKVAMTGTAEPGSKVYLKVLKKNKYVKVAGTTAASDGTFTFAKVSLKLGDNTFDVFATDIAGNIASMGGLVVTYQKV